jgi:HK97 family phage portal protein
MGLLTRFLAPAPQQRSAITLDHLRSLWSPTSAGPSVSEESALHMSAVWGCIRIISEGVAGLPLVLYRQDGRSKLPASEHPLYQIVHTLAGTHWTSFEWREWMLSEVLRWGNAYVRKVYDKDAHIAGLEPLPAAQMEAVYIDAQGRKWFYYRAAPGHVELYPSKDIHHLRGLGDGLTGFSPIGVAARQAVGLGLATEEYGSRLFVNGARPGLILTHPGKLSASAYERLRNDFASDTAGLANVHKTKIIEEGMGVEKLSFPPDEAQFLETRRFQIEEIARIYRVPLHMLQDLTGATFSNIEHQSLDFVKFTLGPWLVRHEQAMHRDFLEPDERPNLYLRYKVQGLERGDFATRTQGYNTGVMTGWLSRNEVRELEDLNPADELDAYLVPLNMLEVGQEPPAPTPAPEPAPAEEAQPRSRLHTRAADARERQGLMRRNVRLFEDVAARLVKREAADIRRATTRYLAPTSRGQTRGRPQFEEWLAGFYKEIEAALPGTYRALMESYAEEMMAAVGRELGGKPAPLDAKLMKWLTEYLKNYAVEYARRGELQLLALLAEAESDEEAADLINERMDGWEETEAQKQSLRQAFEAGNALSLYGYDAGGVRSTVWMATGAETCPFCDSLNGQVREIGSAYVEQGQEMEGGAGQTPLAIERDLGHGPLHAGCDCILLAV